VLIQLSRLWNGIHVSADGTTARFEPPSLEVKRTARCRAFSGGLVLIPASIDSAMIAGIAANNASGMCCGNVQDTYHTMASARIVFADGSVLDYSCPDSRQRLLASAGIWSPRSTSSHAA